MKNLKEFRKTLFDDYACERDGKTLWGREGKYLYEECKMEELPKQFQESINEHMQIKRGMGCAMTFGDFIFSNTANKSLHKCFKKVEKVPSFKMKINSLDYQNVEKFIRENGLEVRCVIDCVKNNELHGNLYVDLNLQEYYIKENSTNIEEMDEYFFWKGNGKRTLSLCYVYPCSNYEDVNIKELKKQIISAFKTEERMFFSDKWEMI